MLLAEKDLINLPVQTKSGQALGRVHSFSVDTETQTIYQYHIKPLGLSGLFSHELLIQHEQVISLDNTAIVVDDLVYTQLASTADNSAAV